MIESDILNQAYRKQVIKEIESESNIARKMESLKRFEIYNDRIEKYLYDILQKELSAETISNMRTISSINLSKRIVNEKSSVYLRSPERVLSGSDDKTDELFEAVYRLGCFDQKLKKSNVFLNLMHQCALQMIPKKGKLKLKVLAPHHFDVIPDPEDPSEAMCYILSQYDKSQLFSGVGESANTNSRSSGVNPREVSTENKKIGDANDWKDKRGKYVWWTDSYHFVTNEKGQMLSDGVLAESMELNDILNPIGQMPFVDVKEDNDGEYWSRYGNSDVDFTLDMALILSDVAEVNRLQGFAQPIISAIDPPVDLKVGANTVIFLKKDKNADQGAQPSFEFASPNPDLSGSIEMIKTFLSMYLTSQSLDPATVNADGSSIKYASGIDRLLANIEKFEASQDDFALYDDVELQLFQLVKKWLDAFSGVSEGGLDNRISGVIPDSTELRTIFSEPSSLTGEKERMDLLMDKVDRGLKTRLSAVMELENVDEDAARKILDDIQLEQMIKPFESAGDGD